MKKIKGQPSSGTKTKINTKMGLVVNLSVDSILFVIDESGLDIQLSGLMTLSMAYEDPFSSDMNGSLV